MHEAIDKIINTSIEYGCTIGANCMILKDGKEIFSDSYGFADKENGIPMKKDHIFRLFSLSKPVTAAAAMILIDRGLLSADDAVSEYLPEYAQLNYVENDKILPCPVEMKISHLLNMTSGLPYADNWGISVRGAARLFDDIISGQNSGNELTTVEIARKAADIPLMFKPGDNWYYGISADIMGAVIEIISGMKYSEFLKKNIFEPLGMYDTGFYVPEEKRERLSALYEWKNDAITRTYQNYLGLTDYTKAPGFESGGAGLVSTIEDYSKFACMLAGRGEFNGVRLFSEETFSYMNTPQLSDKQLTGMWDRLSGYNYGNFMRILVNPELSQLKTVKGEFGWDGWTGTFVAADPENNIVCLYFTQICGAGTTPEAAAICETVYNKLVRN